MSRSDKRHYHEVMLLSRCLLVALVISLAGSWSASADVLDVLVIGGSGGSHRTGEMVELVVEPLLTAGIKLEYSEDLDGLSKQKLAGRDVVAIYKDNDDLSEEQEAALLGFVEGGGGLVAIHCASHCFRRSDAYTKLVGGRFLRHGGEEFRAHIVDAQHPAMRGVQSFAGWDETYVHDQIGDDIRVLMTRPEAGGYEPYTWVRRHGKGRVYYTALGHDHHTWRNPEFHRLLTAAVRWAAGRVPDDPPAITLGDDPPKPLRPEQSVRYMHLPEGFRAELFAAEPDVVKPITMTFDDRGRLWIVESTDYPNNVLPEGEGNDRIKICEDTDGDGRADQFTVFAEGLNIPTSLYVTGDGVLVAVAPHLLLLRDTDGDDVADSREVVYTGLGRADTHAVLSNIHYGLDNWYWAAVGYSGGEVTAGDQTHVFKQGLLRFRLDGRHFEVLTPTSNNTWGLGFDATGNVFASTANGEHSVHLAIPNRYFERVRGWHGVGSEGIADHESFHNISPDLRQVDHHGQYTAAAGHEIYNAAVFGPEYRQRVALTCEPTGHLVHVDFLVERGAGFVARDGWNLLASEDPWTAPIEAQVGPDGAVWMIDWYNYIVRHNPTPPGFETGKGNAYVTPERDKTHGRVYRIVDKDVVREPAGDVSPAMMETPSLEGTTPAEWVELLKSDNQFWRLAAQRRLVERGKKDVLQRLLSITQTGGNVTATIHALWTMHGLGVLDDAGSPWIAVLMRATHHPDPEVRRNALQMLPQESDGLAQMLAARLVADESPRVRLAALLAIADQPRSRASGEAVAVALSDETVLSDRWLRAGATCAAAANDAEFLKSLAVRDIVVSADAAAKLNDAVAVVSEHFARGRPDAAGPVMSAVSRLRSDLLAAFVRGLSAGWPDDLAPPAAVATGDVATGDILSLWYERVPQSEQSQVLKLVRRWSAGDRFAGVLAELRADLVARLEDDEAAVDARIEAVRQLASFDLDGELDGEIVAALTDRLSPREDTRLVEAVLDALAAHVDDATAAAVLAQWPRLTPMMRDRAAGLLLGRRAGVTALVDELTRGTLAASDLRLDQRQQLLRHPDVQLRERAAKVFASGGTLPDENRQRVVEAALPLASHSSDAEAGQRIFVENCAKCHRHGDLGESIGPDLSGMAVRPAADLLADVLDPNRSVEGNFQQYTVITDDGRTTSGLMVAETKTTLELLDTEAKRHVVLRDDVEEFVATGKSLMPEGFEQLGDDKLAALLAFLTKSGRYVPLPIDKIATSISTHGMFYDRASTRERLVFDSWGQQRFEGVPFQLVDPRGAAVPNVVLLNSPNSDFCRELPSSVRLKCGTPAEAIHLLGGVSGWGFPLGEEGSTSLIMRLHYKDGVIEDHPLLNGVHLADYIRPIEVPASKLAFNLGGRQLRYLAVRPARAVSIAEIEFLKGDDRTAPLVMAATVERPSSDQPRSE